MSGARTKIVPQPPNRQTMSDDRIFSLEGHAVKVAISQPLVSKIVKIRKSSNKVRFQPRLQFKAKNRTISSNALCFPVRLQCDAKKVTNSSNKVAHLHRLLFKDKTAL